jgi:hypothetical protein
VGRTARAGRSGRAVTLVGEGQRAALKELVKKAKDVVHSRVVPADVIAKFKQVVHEMEGDIRAVFDMEGEEKAARLAEMEANKLQNTMRFSEEIHARPAKTWFQTPAEKSAAKEAAARVFGNDDDDGEDDEDRARSRKDRKGKAAEEEEEGKKLTPKQLARAEAKLAAAKEKKKDSMLGLSRAKKRRKLMEIEARQAAAEAIAEAKKHAPDDLRSQALPRVQLPPTFEKQQQMQRLMGKSAKKAQRAEALKDIGVSDVKAKRREQQAVIQIRMDKKKGKDTYNDGLMEDVDGGGGSSSSKKKSSSSSAGSSFRFQTRTGSGDDRFKLPRRKAAEEKAARSKSEKGGSEASSKKKKSGVKTATNSFKSKSKFKRRK